MKEMGQILGEKLAPHTYVQWDKISPDWRTWINTIHTNIAGWDALFLILETKHLNLSKINFWLLPMMGSKVDQKRTHFMVEQMTQPSTSTQVTTVGVWNGASRPGLALTAVRQLRVAGFDVIEWGTSKTRQEKTSVINRGEAVEAARRVAHIVGAKLVFSDVDPVRRMDVEVVLGEDYPGDDL
jgi:hypothetical protein